MRRLPRPIRLSIFFAAVALIVLLVVLGIRALVGSDHKAGDEGLKISALPGETILPYGDGFIASDGVRTRSYDGRNKLLWEYTPDSNARQVTASDRLIALWREDNLHLIGQGYDITYNSSLGSPIEAVRCGLTQAAAYLPDKGEILVLNADGKTVDTIRVNALTVLDFGFYSESDLLWVLLLDSSGALPVTHLNTYQPGKQVTTGSYRFSDQIIYKAHFTTAATYAIGTREITTIKSSEIQKDPTLIYGWQLLDIAQGKDGWRMLFTLSGESASGQPSRLKLVKEGGSEGEVHLPAGCMAAFVSDKQIYGVAGKTIYVLPYSGSSTTAYDLPFEITAVHTKLTKNRLIVQVGEEMRLITLP